jgi:hypothetical protein
MAAARMMAIACGYEDADDLDTLRHDSALKIACGRVPESGVGLPSQPTISRLENLADTHALYRIGIGLIDLFCGTYRSTPNSIVLDIDDTSDMVHGGQKLALFNTHAGGYSFQPIHIFESNSGKPILSLSRALGRLRVSTHAGCDCCRGKPRQLSRCCRHCKIRFRHDGPIAIGLRHGRSGAVCFPHTSVRHRSSQNSCRCNTSAASSRCVGLLSALPSSSEVDRRVDPLNQSVFVLVVSFQVCISSEETSLALIMRSRSQRLAGSSW